MNYSKEELVEKLGIGALDDDVQEQVLGAFLKTLEMRTGQAVTDGLSDGQLAEFDKIVNEKGDEAGETWLRQAVPDFDNLEQKTFDTLIAEVKKTGGVS